jgi:CBS domain-containing protein
VQGLRKRRSNGTIPTSGRKGREESRGITAYSRRQKEIIAMLKSPSPAKLVGEIAGRNPVCVNRDTTILAVSKLMRLYRVDELVVTEQPEGKLVPAGVLSARDIVTRVIAPELDAAVLTAGDLLWSGPASAKNTDSISQALELLQATKSNAIALVDDDGVLTGVVSRDELLRATGAWATSQ